MDASRLPIFAGFPPLTFNQISDKNSEHPLPQHADICIIGGGYVGTSAALHLAEQGREVVLLEAGDIGSGASGMSGGHVSLGMRIGMHDVVNRLGMRMATALWELSRNGVRTVKEIIEKIEQNGGSCHYRPGYVTVARTYVERASVEQDIDYHRETFGYDGYRFLDQSSLSHIFKTPCGVGGMYSPHEGQIDPWPYVRGIADVAESCGAMICKHTPVKNISGAKHNMEITTSGGQQMTCDHIIYAGGYMMAHQQPMLHQRTFEMRTTVIVTDPVDEKIISEVMPQGTRPFADLANDVCYGGFDAANRLYFGTGIGVTNPGKSFVQRAAKTMLPPEMVPYIKKANSYSGVLNLTRDRLPYVGASPNLPQAHFAVGLGGHGVALGTHIGKVLADKVMGHSVEYDLLASLPHSLIPTTPIVRAAGVAITLNVVRRIPDGPVRKALCRVPGMGGLIIDATS